MSDQKSLLTELQAISQLIKENKIEGPNGALKTFEGYLGQIKSLGEFDIDRWNKKWRLESYSFGKLFETGNHFDSFLRIIDKSLTTSKSENEALLFLKSEILISAKDYPKDDKMKFVQGLVHDYPYNPEFRHSLGHYLKSEKKYQRAIENYKYALNLEPKCDNFITSWFNAQYAYINSLIRKSKYKDAQIYIDKVLEELDVWQFKNILIELKTKIQDYKDLNNKITKAEQNFKILVEEKLTSERKRLIEVLGFFSGIVAFILSSLTIAINFTLNEALILIVSIGLILIVFVSALSLVFIKREGRLIIQGRFWLLICSLLFLTLLLLVTRSLN